MPHAGRHRWSRRARRLNRAWLHPSRPSIRSPLDEGRGFTIRFAYPDDATALRRLAALDSQPALPEPVLVADVDGELWAAVTIGAEARTIADPFRHTAVLVALLREGVQRLTHPAAHLTSPVSGE